MLVGSVVFVGGVEGGLQCRGSESLGRLSDKTQMGCMSNSRVCSAMDSNCCTDDASRLGPSFC